jgi:hypothetical protein
MATTGVRVLVPWRYDYHFTQVADSTHGGVESRRGNAVVIGDQDERTRDISLLPE